MNRTGRVASIDCARALCMLYIVGVYHMQSTYVRGAGVLPLLTSFVMPVLATFTAISGYFMGRRTVESRADAAAFYKRRLLRVYPFYALSCLSLYVVSLVSVKYVSGAGQLALSLAGLSMVFGPAPKTLWYTSMLMLFWALTPLFNFRKRRTPLSVLGRLAGMLALMYLILGLSRLGARVDARIYLYGIVYFVSAIAADFIRIDDRIRPLPTLIAAVAVAAVQLEPVKAALPEPIQQLITAFGGVLLMLFIGRLCARVAPLARVLNWISYGSMVAYLFHRQWLGLWLTVLGPFSWPLAAVLVAALTAGSYWAQRFYDRCLDRLEGSGRKDLRLEGVGRPSH